MRRIDGTNGLVLPGQFQITRTGAVKEIKRLLFDAVQFAAGTGALQAHLRGHVQIQRQVRTEIAQNRVAKRSQHGLIDTPATALIRLG